MRGATSNQMSYVPNGYDHSNMFKGNYISNRFDHMNAVNETLVSPSNGDLFGLSALRHSLVSPSRQPVPSIFNMTGDIHSTTNTDFSGFESSIMNFADKADIHAYEHCGRAQNCGHSPRPEDIRRSNKLMLDISKVKNSVMMSNRNNGSSPPFSDSSLSTGSSNLDTGFFSHSIHTGRSDSPNSVVSNSSTESTSNHQLHPVYPQLTEQEFANLQSLHVINCMSNISKDQFMQTINMLHSVLCQKPAPILENDALEMEAKYHRKAAVSGNSQAPYTWSGKLPQRSYKGGPYSCKVFLGGVPWEISEENLLCSFRHFGNVKVEWPGKEAVSQPKGYAYVLFENDSQVKMLLDSCREGVGENEGSFYYKIPTRKSKPKEVQVIPWSISDSNYSVKTYQKLDPLTTVFVGALHGMMNAEGLFRVMNDLFGGVVYAGIDTDKNKYPIGAGRVTFDNYLSYVKAVTAAFVDIKTPKFNKKIQVDPYMQDTPCSSCRIQMGPYFCRANGCFRYFCTGCWNKQHVGLLASHKPLMRNSKHGVTSATPVPSH